MCIAFRWLINDHRNLIVQIDRRLENEMKLMKKSNLILLVSRLSHKRTQRCKRLGLNGSEHLAITLAQTKAIL